MAVVAVAVLRSSVLILFQQAQVETAAMVLHLLSQGHLSHAQAAAVAPVLVQVLAQAAQAVVAQAATVV
jgi:hypothetical protein